MTARCVIEWVRPAATRHVLRRLRRAVLGWHTCPQRGSRVRGVCSSAQRRCPGLGHVGSGIPGRLCGPCFHSSFMVWRCRAFLGAVSYGGITNAVVAACRISHGRGARSSTVVPVHTSYSRCRSDREGEASQEQAGRHLRQHQDLASARKAHHAAWLTCKARLGTSSASARLPVRWLGAAAVRRRVMVALAQARGRRGPLLAHPPPAVVLRHLEAPQVVRPRLIDSQAGGHLHAVRRCMAHVGIGGSVRWRCGASVWNTEIGQAPDC